MIPKFRAWYSGVMEMVHFENPFVGFDGEGNAKMMLTPREDKIYLGSCELMQYTGLRDRNGKEIYEGDIVRDPDNIGIVFWNEFRAMFGIDTSITDRPSKSKKFTAPFDDWCEWLVIGNVHENPELLEAK